MVHKSFWFRLMLVYWVQTQQNNTEALVVTNLETGLEENTEVSNYMFMSREQGAVQN